MSRLQILSCVYLESDSGPYNLLLSAVGQAPPDVQQQVVELAQRSGAALDTSFICIKLSDLSKLKERAWSRYVVDMVRFNAGVQRGDTIHTNYLFHLLGGVVDNRTGFNSPPPFRLYSKGVLTQKEDSSVAVDVWPVARARPYSPDQLRTLTEIVTELHALWFSRPTAEPESLLGIKL